MRGPAGPEGTDEKGSGQAGDKAGLFRLGKEKTWSRGGIPRDLGKGIEGKWLREGTRKTQWAVSNSERQE